MGMSLAHVYPNANCRSYVRWQRGEPVTAHPPTLRYVAGRYVRRHIVPLAISAVAVLGLLVTAIVALLIHSILIGRRRPGSKSNVCWPNETSSVLGRRGSVVEPK